MLKKLTRLFLLALTTLTLLGVHGATAQEMQGGQKVDLRVFAGADAAVPGQTLHLAIRQTIADGWHTYWTNPGDSGQAMKIRWTLPQGYTVSDMLWPAPDRIPYGPLMNFGYMDQAVMLADLAVPADAPVGSILTVQGQANVLVCDEICIPEDHEISLEIPVAATARPDNADLFAGAGAAIPQPVDWRTVTEIGADEVRVRITLPQGGDGAAADLFARAPEDVIWFPYEWGYIDNASDQIATYDPGTRTLTLRESPSDSRDVSALKGAAYLLRSGDRAVIVTGDLKLLGAPVMGPRASAVTDTALPLLLVFAFIGGLILNLMPCVFPVLSMKALHLVTLSGAERAHARTTGLLYAAGVIVTFLALAAILLSIRAAGAQIGWGFQLQNPVVVAGLAWLLFVTGLNLAGLFDLRIAFGGEVLLAERHHPLVTSFLTGILATLVATPCSAPFMATAMGAALVEPVPVALAIFATVGLGLAFPYLLLCFVPVLQKILPRPGAWMGTFRQVLSFPMFASAVWMVWVVAQQGGPSAVGWTLAGMVVLAFAVWLLDRQPQGRLARHLVTVAGTACIVFALAGLPLTVRPAPTGDDDALAANVNYKPYAAEALDHILRDTNRPAFVNMTASWCITCLVNERTTLETPEVHDLFKTMDMAYFKGDWTNEAPAITAFLQGYGRSGVPIYVYYAAPDAATGKRPDPVVLPQILTPSIIFETLR